jgi:hypothetical protein
VVLEQYKAAAGSGSSYTVIYASGPRTEKPPTYTAEFTDSGAGHAELKRQLYLVDSKYKRQEKGDRNLPLFEKYQFFTPGESFLGSFPNLLVVLVLSPFRILGFPPSY